MKNNFLYNPKSRMGKLHQEFLKNRVFKPTKPQFKEYTLKDLETEETGTVRGIASTPDVDYHGDIIQSGAFKKSLGERMPNFLWQHKSDEPIGRITIAAETELGLQFEGKLNRNTEMGKKAFYCLEHGDINGISIGFMPVKGKYEYNKNTGGYIFQEVNLREISLVTDQANPYAQVTQFKEFVAKASERILNELTPEDYEMVLSYAEFLCGKYGNEAESLYEEEPESEDDPQAMGYDSEDEDKAEDATPFELLAAVAKELKSTAGLLSNEPVHSPSEADILENFKNNIRAISQKENYDKGNIR